jgi:ammonia channel protein AmtB
MYSSVNTIWVLFGTALVFFMQAGFSLCEAGFTRAKNTGNILMKTGFLSEEFTRVSDKFVFSESQ